MKMSATKSPKPQQFISTYLNNVSLGSKAESSERRTVDRIEISLVVYFET
ncbi:unnamed protein product [Acidithrix sp. C25]|nr:unnamed protein product [Acidithrix sp. C25]